MRFTKMAQIATVALMVSASLIGCDKGGGKNSADPRTATVASARGAFNTCLQRANLGGYYGSNSDRCYQAQGYNICSLSAYYWGQCGYTGNGGGNNQYNNQNLVIDSYFNSYLIQFPAADINQLIQQWNYM